MQYKKLIQTLGFTPKENSIGIFQKKYANAGGYCIDIDFENQKINFGDQITTENKTTQNFSQAENWVVIECVDRLLEKGYQPQNITLEKTWATGHGTSGRLDVLVSHDDGSAYLMIECKTYGAEFDKEYKKLLKDGGQLFTYFQQDKNANVLMLYASELANAGALLYRNEIIKIEDDYRETSNVKDFYDRWSKLPKANGVFDSWVKPYDFQSKALTPNSLKDITQEDSSFIFNQFLEILRHNVVSDKPNAFNKIFTLFLCKIYDEKTTKPNDELAFQWFYTPYNYDGIAYPPDDNISFQKRLTDLYKKGMYEFLDKTITDISDAEFEKKYASMDEKTRNLVLNELTEIRLKKNNEFAIKEVFDDDSFNENAKVVKEVVELLQGYKIRYTKKQQYLSDFFELLLTTGLKQESGQFFTPVPIAQFIIKSLPLDQLVAKKLNAGEKNNLLPTVIDYAAGSGHFVTESMHELQRIIDKANSQDFIDSTAREIRAWKEDHFRWALQYVYGIEKDYRLVKVGKVGCYLHGDGLAQIIHSDGLANFTKSSDYKGLLKKSDKDFPKENKQFDIVVSNPPYSVSAFKNNAHKYYTKDDFNLYDKLTDQSSEIECLFIERMQQLLKDGGLAGVILPSSILSNTGIYTSAREIILQYFEIIAIAELGSNTFMATGTNTIVLFLRRRNNYGSINIRDSVNKALTDMRDVTINGIEKVISQYVAYVWEGLNFSDYQTLLQKQPSETVQQHEIYQEYLKWKTDKVTLATESAWWDKVLMLEAEKLFYFVLAYPQTVVLVKTGEKNEEKQFLGYEFSNRRGFEGIHPTQRDKSIDECTKLFDSLVFDNPEKASTYIYQAFSGDFTSQVHHSLENNISRISLVNMLTFNRTTFEKNISTSIKKKVTLESKWQQVRLGDVCKLYQPKTITSAKIKHMGPYKVFGANGVIGYFEEYNHEAAEVTITCRGATCGTINFTEPKSWITGNAMVAQPLNNSILKKYLLKILIYCDLSITITGAAQPQITRENLSPYKIPLPPLDIQQKIVDEIAVLEAKEQKTKETIEKLNLQIENVLQLEATTNTYRFSDLATLEYGKALHRNDRKIGEYSVMGSNGAVGMHNTFLVEGPCIIVGRKGSAGKINYVETNCYPIDTTFYVNYNKNVVYLKYLFHILLNLDLESIAKGKGIGVPGLNRNDVHGLKVSIHPLEIQKEIVVEIENIENKISALEAELVEIPSMKNAILNRHLN